MIADDFERVLKGKYPAKSHAKRLVQLLLNKVPHARGIVYLQGRVARLQEDNDSPDHFRQRRHFYYLTGCNLPDCHYIYDIHLNKSILFIPPVDPDEVIWSGLPMSTSEALQLYDVDDVLSTTEINSVLDSLNAKYPRSTAYSISGRVPEPEHVALSKFQHNDSTTISGLLDEARVVKDEYEIALISKANHISSKAHAKVMERTRTALTESELEATFIEHCSAAAGAKEMAYPPIFASGRAPATLHYEANNAPLAGKQNLLVDAGAEWGNYSSDITRTYPLSGKFSRETRDIYDIVLKMQRDCIAMVKDGVDWDDVHVLAHEIAIDGLLELGILKGNRQAIWEAQTSMAFFPHGLGHYLGLDTHDTGGNPTQRPAEGIFRYLRKRGRLPAGAVITVEPGIYFCDHIISPYLEDPKHKEYIDSEVLKRYWDVGGVRIEDNVLVTLAGSKNLTTLIKEPEELEAAILGF